MSQPPPFRQRPNLHLAFAPLTGFPKHYINTEPTSRSETPVPTPTGTPLATTLYSPFALAGLKAPKVNSFSRSDSNGAAIPYKPWLHELPFYSKYSWFRVRRIFSSKPVWLFLMALALTLWWFSDGGHELDVVKLTASGFGKEFMQGRRMQDYQFYPASNPKIYVCMSSSFSCPQR